MDKKIILKVKKKIRLKGVEVASSPWKLALGLMFRKSMPRGRGMLFDTHYTDRHGVWMLFMRFPISIYFLDSRGNSVDAVKNAMPLNIFNPATWKIYKPRKPCRYVVEVSCT